MQEAFAWNDERIALLVKMRDEGISARDIGERLGASKNAVLGKVFRMALPPPAVKPKSTPGPRKPRETVKNRQRPRIVRANGNSNALRVIKSLETEQYKLRCVEIECLTPFDDVTGCRYPVGDGPFLFCNGTRAGGSSYCLHHHALCLEKPRAKELAKHISENSFVDAAMLADELRVKHLSPWAVEAYQRRLGVRRIASWKDRK